MQFMVGSNSLDNPGDVYGVTDIVMVKYLDILFT